MSEFVAFASKHDFYIQIHCSNHFHINVYKHKSFNFELKSIQSKSIFSIIESNTRLVCVPLARLAPFHHIRHMTPQITHINQR